jgi:hypothetical protein
MSINQVLHQIQKKLSVPKERINSFAKYKYRTAEDIVEAVKKLLPEGYVLLLHDEMMLLGDRHYVKATARLVGTDTTGIVEATSVGYAREAKEKKGFDESQITGATSSYARKYALNGLLAIDDGNDADTGPVIMPASNEKWQKANNFVNSYIKDLKECKTLDDMMQFTSKNSASLKRIHEEYSDLSKKINDATEERRKSYVK